MNKLKTFKGACLVAATAMLPLSQAAMAEVTISGWANEAVTFYDDGSSSDAVQNNAGGNTLGTRLTFTASNEVATGLTAGFEVIIEPRHIGLDWGTLGVADNEFGDPGFSVLSNNVHLAGAWGKITFGNQSMPTDNIAVLEDPSLTLWSGISPVFIGNGVIIQNGGVANAVGSVFGDFLNCLTAPGLRGNVGIGLDCNGVYRRGVRYDLPAFGPVSIAIGYANDDIYDISGKWKGSLGRMKASIALGYAINQGPVDELATAGASDFINTVAGALYDEAENFQVQAGLMDPETGLFGSIAYQSEDADLTATGIASGMDDDTDAWWLKIGIKKQWFSLGDTSIAFDYGQYNDQFGSVEGLAGVTGSEVERLGFSIDQYFGSSLIIYGKYQVLDVDVDCTAATTCVTAYGGADDLDTFSLGAVYFF
ncbi:MAG: porin [Proteobacteria bacterium]|nr:porin [Pseudomonadota bacterium]